MYEKGLQSTSFCYCVLYSECSLLDVLQYMITGIYVYTVTIMAEEW